MDEQDIEFKIGAIVISFKEYIYGFKRLKRVAADQKSSKNKVLFYQHACYNYLACYFLIEDAFVAKSLKEVGLSKLLDPIIKIINLPVGKTTYGEFVRQLRNKAIVHNGYSSSKIHNIFQSAELYRYNSNEQLAMSNLKMFEEIKKLQRKLISHLPKGSGY